MHSINPPPILHDPPTRAAESETSTPGDSAHKERGMTCGIGRSGRFVMAVIAVAVIAVAGLSFGWNGWLTASLGGISLLFLLPCLAMCAGMIWMMMRGGSGQSSPPTQQELRKQK